MADQQQVQGGDSQPTPKRSRLGRVAKIALWFLLINLVLFVLVQLPFVQSFAAKVASNLLSRKLETSVTVDRLQVSLITPFKLEGVVIYDQSNALLLNSGRVFVDFDIWHSYPFSNKLVVDEISLVDAELNLVRDTLNLRGNWAPIIDLFSSDKPKQKSENKTPLEFDFSSVNLENLKFTFQNQLKGKSFFADLGSASVTVDSFSVKEGAAINDLFLENPQFRMIIEEGDCNYLAEKERRETELVLEESITTEEVEAMIDSLAVPFRFSVNKFRLNNGVFQLDNYKKDPVGVVEMGKMNYAHIKVRDINIDMDFFRYQQDTMRAQVNYIKANDQGGFELRELSSTNAMVSDKGFALGGLKLITNKSSLGDSLAFGYKSWSDFGDFSRKIRMYGDFNNSSVALSDVMNFAPGLYKNPFFVNSKNQTVRINGVIRDRVNDLSSSNDLELSLPGKLYLQGRFDFNNLLDKDEQFLNLRVDRFQTTIPTIRQLIPGVNIPQNFDRLGNLDFSGNFVGFFNVFSTNGSFQTDLGLAVVDNIRFSTAGKRETATYNGSLRLSSFDLGAWTGNANFGTVSARLKIVDGIGITAESAQATLIGGIDSLTLKGYTYKDFNLDGLLNQRFFEGKLLARDPNVNLDFLGTIDFTQSRPKFNFTADINTLRTSPLNFTKDDFDVSGKVTLDITDLKLSDLTGDVALENFELIKNERDTFRMESMTLSSIIESPTQKQFIVDSELANIDLKGNFILDQIPIVFQQFILNNYPLFAREMRIDTSIRSKIVQPHDFAFEVDVNHTGNLTKLFLPAIDSLHDIAMNGFLSNTTDSLDLNLQADELKTKAFVIDDIYIRSTLTENNGSLDLGFAKSKFGKIEVQNTNALFLLYGDSLQFTLGAQTDYGAANNLWLSGDLFSDGDNYHIWFDDLALFLLNDTWNINPGNHIRIGKNDFDIENFFLQNEEKKIWLKSPSKGALQLSLADFDLHFIDDLWKFDKLDFFGPFALDVTVNDIYNLHDLNVRLHADSLQINHDYFGSLDVAAHSDSLSAKATAEAHILKGEQQLHFDGFYNPPNYKPKKILLNSTRDKPDFLDFQLRGYNYPINMLEYFIADGISKTVGKVDAEVRLYGNFKKAKMEGPLVVKEAATTIAYTNTRYFIPRDTAYLTSDRIDFTGSKIYDVNGDSATLTGGLRHRNLAKLGVDVAIDTRSFQVLNTGRNDNEVYYGSAYADGSISFVGNKIGSPDITIKGSTLEGTHIKFPLSGNEGPGSIDYINFIDRTARKTDEKIKRVNPLDGVSVEMEILLTPDATMEMIFDESARDILKGTGTGNIRMTYPRNEEIQVFGTYEVEEGEYLFTFGDVVNKDFTVQQGGTVRWEGDPFNAVIDVTAVYQETKASISAFIAEFLPTLPQELIQQAQRPVPVDLKMFLEGNLIQPDVSFDIAFGKVDPELSSFVQNKLRLLRLDPDEMNRQVLGLVVLGQFLQPSGNLQGLNIGTGINNTLTEFLSNQISYYVTNLLSSLITEDGVVSGINFDVGYNQYSGGADANFNRFQELRNSVEVQLFDNRLVVTVGGGVDFNNTLAAQNNNLSGEFQIDYALTPDGRFRVSMFNFWEPEIAGGRRRATGVGLIYRKEFSNFEEFFREMGKDPEKERLKVEMVEPNRR